MIKFSKKISQIEILTYTILIMILVSFMTLSVVFAKYTSTITKEYDLNSSSFYFSSDLLDEDGGSTGFSTSFDIELYNFDGANYSSYDITYDITVSNIQTSGNNTITVTDNKSGSLAKNVATTATINIAPHADVLSFDITISTTNGYRKTLKQHFGKEYTVTFDKQGGTGGSNSVTAIYYAPMPVATHPDYGSNVFEGYYSATGGGGTKYYNAAMESVNDWNIASNTTLYANWSLTSPFAGGDGTSGDPFQIEDWYHLNNVRDFLSVYFVLNNSLNSASSGYIDLASSTANGGLGWNPLGGATRFTGHFNGQGYTISDLYIDRPSQDNVGLFGHVGISANSQATTIQNICLYNVDITGARGTGALIGRVTGNRLTVIQKACVNVGQVTGTGATGGLIGSHNSFQPTGDVDRNPRLLRSYSNVSVYGVKDAGDARIFEKIGGLVGCSQKGTIINCYSHSSVYADNGVANVGGLFGCNIDRGILQYSYSTGTVTVTTGTNIGGLVGQTSYDGGHVPITLSYWDYQSSGKALGSGIGSGTDIQVTGLTTSQMQGTNAETNMTSFDFINVWQTVTGNYPILR